MALGEADRDDVAIVLAAESRVRGKVFDRAGASIEGATVIVTENLAGAIVANFGVGRSGADGRFDVGGLGPGAQLRVEAEHPKAGRGLAGPFSLEEGAVREIDVRIGEGGFVRGGVRWDDKQPASGITVRGAIKGKRILFATTDQVGQYEVDPFLAGEVVLNAFPNSDALGRSTNTERTVSIGPGQDVDGADLVMPRRNESISGVAIGPEGSPVSGASIGVSVDRNGVSYRPFNKLAIAGGAANYTVLSDDTGTFTIDSLPKGQFTVWGTYPDYPEANAYNVTAGSRSVQLRFSRGAGLSGSARDKEGRPVTTYTLYAVLSQSNDRNEMLKATRGFVQESIIVQNPRGDFRISGLHAATYDLVLTTADGRGGRLEVIPLDAGESKTGLRISVSATVLARGRVVDGNKEPIAGASVGCSVAHMSEERTTRTRADGVFELAGVVAGKVTIGVTDQRTHRTTERVAVIPEGTKTHDFGIIELASGASACPTCGPAPPTR